MCWKGPQNSLKSVVLLVMVNYRERFQIKTSQRMRHTRQSLRVSNAKLVLSSVHIQLGYTILPVLMCDNVYGILPTRDAHLSFYWGFVM